MKCIECGHQTEAREEDRELVLGLPYHVVVSGAPVHVCPNCGARYPGLRAPQASLESLARWIVQRPGRLQASEVQFIRHTLGWSQEQLGRRLGVTVETISRWENGKRPLGYQSELALRFLVLAGDEVAERLDTETDLPATVRVTDDEVTEAA